MKHPYTKQTYSKNLRKNQTREEKLVWYNLRNNALGFKFRRQTQIGSYIVDFVCLEKNLIVELDGGQHNSEENIIKDQLRTNFLQKEGYILVRFWNNEVSENLEEVLIKIKNYLHNNPSPSP